MKAQPQFLDIVDGTKRYMYENLWNICAGRLCTLPQIGEQVYYFPQGQVELIEKSTKEELDQINPLFDIPSKLRCCVTAIKHKVEKDTDEVYAEITLVPYPTQVKLPIPNGNIQRPVIHFTKVLTSSDVSKHGGLSVPKNLATKCLPEMDMSMPTQELLVKDLHDNEWKFTHIFRGTPKKHVFTAGWKTFVTSKKLVVGDSVVFLRGENEKLHVGIKRAEYKQDNKILSLMSPQTMYNGVIASASHAFQNHCMFNVVYKPRLSQSSVVSYEKFISAMNNKFNVGSRFQMKFESEMFYERSYFGTVIGVHDFSPHWKNSEWRSLHVQWDEDASFPRPYKVSPWEIEHITPSSKISQSLFLTNKRFRPNYEIGSTSSNLWNSMLTQDQQTGPLGMSSLKSVSPRSCRDAKRDEEEVGLPENEAITTNATTSFRLFKVDITTPSMTPGFIGPMNSYQKSEICKLSQKKKLNHTQTLTSLKEIQRIRTCTKVHMQGEAIGRGVDLTVFNGYNQLREELDKLFHLKGELQTRNQWEIFFTNTTGDMMVAGDDPWSEFCNVVNKLYIYSKEEVNKMKSKNNLPAGE